ncbi:MAG TPA: hypothetical protein VGJ95_08275 [Pseudonocardiaceae bacterium]
MELLVIALDTKSGQRLRWTGRRHDDDEPDWARGDSDQDLFDSVFHAILDGEQVAVGVDSPLTAPLPEGLVGDAASDETKVLEVADAVPPTAGRIRLNRLLEELGRWRPWTAVTTSRQHWLATRSILVWEAAATPDDSVREFFDFVRRSSTWDQHGPTYGPPAVVNLAIAAALRAGVVAGWAELTQPVLALPTMT